MKNYIYFSPLYGGHYGILTIYENGFTRFEIEWESGPCDGYPEFWNGRWERICEL